MQTTLTDFFASLVIHVSGGFSASVKGWLHHLGPQKLPDINDLGTIKSLRPSRFSPKFMYFWYLGWNATISTVFEQKTVRSTKKIKIYDNEGVA